MKDRPAGCYFTTKFTNRPGTTISLTIVLPSISSAMRGLGGVQGDIGVKGIVEGVVGRECNIPEPQRAGVRAWLLRVEEG